MQVTKNPKKKVLVLASGSGTTFEALAQFSKAPESHYEVVGVVSNQATAFVLERASRLGVPARHIASSKDRPQEFFNETLQWAQELKVEVVALAGFLLLVREPLLSAYSKRILNTHPALLPKFGGRGMYGENVHQAVIAASESESGVTIHLVNEKFDEGQILAQEKVPILKGDSAEMLSERVRSAERVLYPKVLNQFVTGALFP